MFKMKAGKNFPKWLKIILIVFFIVLFSTGTIFLVFQGMTAKGRKSLMASSKPAVITSGQVDASIPDADAYYNGKAYRYKQDLINILCLGVDKNAEEQGRHQADVVLLAVVDEAAGTLQVIAVPRDTITELEVCDVFGAPVSKETAQLALGYAYGNTDAKSCELMERAVSKLLYGVPIENYYAGFFDAVPVINDAVGGVTLTIQEDLTKIDPAMRQGTSITLNGEQAMQFLRSRDSFGDGSNAGRMQHQQQYMEAFLPAAKQAVKQNPFLVKNLFQAVAQYSVTNLSADSCVYLASQALELEFQGIQTIPGTATSNGELAEFHSDDDALLQLVIRVFYEEIQ